MAWLVSDEARYVTGVTLPVDAGSSTSADGAQPCGANRFRPDGAGGDRAIRTTRSPPGGRRPCAVVPAGGTARPLRRCGGLSAAPDDRRRRSGPYPVRGRIGLPQTIHRRQAGRGAGGHRCRRHPRRGHGHQGVPARAAIRHPGFRGDLPVNIARKRAAVRRCWRPPASVQLVPLDFERDDLIGRTGQGRLSHRRSDFFIWEGVTQYLTEERSAPPRLPCGPHRRRAGWCSPTSEGTSSTGEHVRRSDRVSKIPETQQVWHFGLDPDEVSAFVAEYGWRLIEQAGPDYFLRTTSNPPGAS